MTSAPPARGARPRTARALILLLLALVSLVLTIALLKGVDIVLVARSPNEGLDPLFPPSTEATYRTSEFSVVASTNRFGFRGSETALRDRQILAVGDSFTFGWGTSADDTWPSILEAQLRRDGTDIDVYNLGVPGTGTEAHLRVAEYLVELALANGAFVRSAVTESYKRYGLPVPDEDLVVLIPEDMIERRVSPSGATFVRSLARFRSYDGSTELFFPLDGHPTPAGNALTAEILRPVIEAPLRDSPQ